MNHLRSALSKVRHISGREWGGHLTPSEILALVEDGVKPSMQSPDVVESFKGKVGMAEQDKRSGDGRGSWFYFSLGRTKPDVVHHADAEFLQRQ